MATCEATDTVAVRATVPAAGELAEAIAQAAATELRLGHGWARAERAALAALWEAVTVVSGEIEQLEAL